MIKTHPPMAVSNSKKKQSSQFQKRSNEQVMNPKNVGGFPISSYTENATLKLLVQKLQEQLQSSQMEVASLREELARNTKQELNPNTPLPIIKDESMEHVDALKKNAKKKTRLKPTTLPNSKSLERSPNEEQALFHMSDIPSEVWLETVPPNHMEPSPDTTRQVVVVAPIGEDVTKSLLVETSLSAIKILHQQVSTLELVVDHTQHNVHNFPFTDPQGDSGMYTGALSSELNAPQGMGTMVYNRRVYEGEWKHGQWDGHGKLMDVNGDSYEGEFERGQRHGHGMQTWKSGHQYVGAYIRDIRHGKGKFAFADGSIYFGDFKNGVRQGRGRCHFPEGGHYEGEWQNNMFDGKGECVWPNGRSYKGEFKQNKSHGRGVEKYADGRIRHDGMWDADMPKIA